MRIHLPDAALDAAAQRAAVAFFLHRHDARAGFFGDGLRAVGAAVVGDDDFAAHAGALDAEPRLFDAAGDRFRLVQARHDDAQFNGFGHAANLMQTPGIWRARVWRGETARQFFSMCSRHQVSDPVKSVARWELTAQFWRDVRPPMSPASTVTRFRPDFPFDHDPFDIVWKLDEWMVAVPQRYNRPPPKRTPEGIIRVVRARHEADGRARCRAVRRATEPARRCGGHTRNKPMPAVAAVGCRDVAAPAVRR